MDRRNRPDPENESGLMDDYDELQHKNPAHARTVRVSWNLGWSDEDATWVPPTETDLTEFATNLVHHYQVFLGRRLFVELTGPDLEKTPGVIKLLEHLHSLGVRTGIYTEVIHSMDFWKAVKPYVHQLCLVVRAEDSQVFAALVVTELAPVVDVHINYEVSADMEVGQLRKAVAFATSLTEITMNVVVTRGAEAALDATANSRLVGVNASVHRVAGTNRTRQRQSHRGNMVKVAINSAVEVSPRELIANGENSWTDWTCMTGVEQLIITTRGDVIRGWCHQGGVIGNVKSRIVPFPTSGITCGATWCHSTIDIQCTKRWV